MEIRIQGRADTPDYNQEFVVEINVMFGDGDGYQTFEVGPFKNNDTDTLRDLLQTCARMGQAYPHGRGGGDDYYHIEGFYRWFNVDGLSEEEYDALPEVTQNNSVDWPYEPDGMGYQASYQGYDLFYYNANGEKYHAHATGIFE